MFKVNRRSFLAGCSSAIAAMAGARMGPAVFGNPNSSNSDVLITVFLRGGADVLNLFPPIAGDDRGFYESARSELAVPINEALPLANTPFGLHPAADGLHTLFNDNKLAVVLASGMHEDTRSHFDAMSFMELGTPGSKSTADGWLTRHLLSSPDAQQTVILPAMSLGPYTPNAYRASNDVVSLTYPTDFNINTGHWDWIDAQKIALSQIYGDGFSPVHLSGLHALQAMSVIEPAAANPYTPAGGAQYPFHEFGNHLKVIAQMVKQDIGLKTATVDLGSWDTHDNQGDGSGGYFAGLVQTLSQGLMALYQDLAASHWMDRVTVVVMSEFGRRLDQNANGGTDHGHGGAMLIMGNNVVGGIHGDWPGLNPSHLYQGIDLEVTTDYRNVLSEILLMRCGNPNYETVFPGFTDFQALDLVYGSPTGWPPDPAPAPIDRPYEIFMPVVNN